MVDSDVYHDYDQDCKEPCDNCGGLGVIPIGVNDAYGLHYDEAICRKCRGRGWVDIRECNLINMLSKL